jgi:hypothetical protein
LVLSAFLVSFLLAVSITQHAGLTERRFQIQEAKAWGEEAKKRA